MPGDAVERGIPSVCRFDPIQLRAFLVAVLRRREPESHLPEVQDMIVATAIVEAGTPEVSAVLAALDPDGVAEAGRRLVLWALWDTTPRRAQQIVAAREEDRAAADAIILERCEVALSALHWSALNPGLVRRPETLDKGGSVLRMTTVIRFLADARAGRIKIDGDRTVGLNTSTRGIGEKPYTPGLDDTVDDIVVPDLPDLPAANVVATLLAIRQMPRLLGTVGYAGMLGLARIVRTRQDGRSLGRRVPLPAGVNPEGKSILKRHLDLWDPACEGMAFSVERRLRADEHTRRTGALALFGWDETTDEGVDPAAALDGAFTAADSWYTEECRPRVRPAAGAAFTDVTVRTAFITYFWFRTALRTVARRVGGTMLEAYLYDGERKRAVDDQAFALLDQEMTRFVDALGDVRRPTPGGHDALPRG